MKLHGRRCCLLASVFVFVTHGLALAEAGSSDSTCLGHGVDSRQTGNATGIWPWQEYVSVDYHPPVLDIDATDELAGEKLAPGYIFIAPSTPDAANPSSTKQTAPVILTDTGDLVWNGPSVFATDFRAQTLNNKPVLTYWHGDVKYNTGPGLFVGRHGYGSVTILDESYKQIASVCPQISLRHVPPGSYACSLDLHESKITSRNTILLTAYNVTEADLSAVGGPKKGFIYDGLFFEVALDGSQEILFQWSSIEHVPVDQSKLPIDTTGHDAANAYDYFHINSVDLVGSNFLVNSRHTWSTYLVEPSGKIAWTVQGEAGGDFGKLPPEGRFKWQHDARAHHVSNSSITISWFNNEYNHIPDVTNTNPPTSAIALRLSLPPNPKKPPVVLTHVTNTPPIFVASQGSYDLSIPGESGHQFVGFGQIPVVREYSSRAKGSSGLLWSARFGVDNLVQSYRGYKLPWQGTPHTKPTLVVKPGEKASCRSGYVSWNGATKVTSYIVYEGATSGCLFKTGSVKKAGFETAFGVSQKFVQVGAVEGSEEVSRSEVVIAFLDFPERMSKSDQNQLQSLLSCSRSSI